MNKRNILIINHIFWPDNINTARHISELAEELSLRSWNVSALVGNRYYRNNEKIGRNFNIWNNVKIHRVYTPKINNESNIGRLFTSFWLLISFALKLPFMARYDAIILGSNPPFSFFIIPYLKIIRSNSKLFYWSFDLYPDAIYASKNNHFGYISKILKLIISRCYNKLDILVDIGNCMRMRLKEYTQDVNTQTLTPWSFVEQKTLDEVHLPTRQLLFGDAKLAIMYTGTIGYAHEFDNFLALARELKSRNASVAFCFAGFGKKMDELKSLCGPNDTNISFAGFVNTDRELEERLSSSDLMMVSLRNEWTGISVPSKFFTSIATGKPVLFSGSRNSAIASWINEYNLGLHLTNENINLISEELIKISNDYQLISDIKANCLNTYNSMFSKKNVCDNWSKLLLNNID